MGLYQGFASDRNGWVCKIHFKHIWFDFFSCNPYETQWKFKRRELNVGIEVGLTKEGSNWPGGLPAAASMKAL